MKTEISTCTISPLRKRLRLPQVDQIMNLLPSTIIGLCGRIIAVEIWDIFMYDLSTLKETQITTSGLATNAVIYGDRIVWEDNRSGNDDIYMYDVITSKETPVTTSGSAYSPAIYGDRIVWEDWRNGNGDIYMYNLYTSNETQITTNESDKRLS